MRLIEASKRIFSNNNCKSSLGILIIFYLIVCLTGYLLNTFVDPQINTFLAKPTLDGFMQSIVPISLSSLGNFVMFFIQIVVTGYIVMLIRNFVINDTQFLPDWKKDIVKTIVLGFKYTIGILIISTALAAIAAIGFLFMAVVLGVILGLIFSLMHMPFGAAMTVTILLSFILAVLLYAIPLIMFTTAITMNFSIAQTFKSIFDFKRIIEIIKSNKKEYAKLVLLTCFITVLYLIILLIPIILITKYFWLAVPVIMIYWLIAAPTMVFYGLVFLAINVLYANYIKTYVTINPCE